MYISYDNISSKSKSWIYILSKNIDKNILLDLNTFLIKICENWKSHGQITKASYVISNNRFIILFAEDNNLISGCSIDKSNKELRKKLISHIYLNGVKQHLQIINLQISKMIL